VIWLLALLHGPAFGEGSDDVDTTQRLDHRTDIFVDVLAPGERIAWTGEIIDGWGAVTPVEAELERPDGTLEAVLASGEVVLVDEAGAWVIRPVATDAYGPAVLEEDPEYSGPPDGANDPLDVWDVEVLEAAAGFGRVWSDKWQFNTGKFRDDNALFGSLYMLVGGGSGARDSVVELLADGLAGNEYEVTAGPVGATLSADATVSAHGRSVDQVGWKAVPETPIYLNPPEVARFNPGVPQVTDEASICDGLALGVASGGISFTTDVVGVGHLVCDLNEDGVFDLTSEADLHRLNRVEVGANFVEMDGARHDGTAIEPGVYPCTVRVTVGEMHFAAKDMETSFEGLRLYRVAPDLSRHPLVMYWNDAMVQGAAVEMPDGQTSQQSSGALGMDPGEHDEPALANDNARAWGNFGSRSKGQAAFVDTYTWIHDVVSDVVPLVVMDPEVDTDGDGVVDAAETCGHGSSHLAYDTDGDGIHDGLEILVMGSDPLSADSDGDGVADVVEAGDPYAPTDTDGDGLFDIIDDDDDDDGVPTLEEDRDLTPGPESDDYDGDGVPDYLDDDDDGDGVPVEDVDGDGDPRDDDFDEDGIADHLDDDDDGDGVPTLYEDVGLDGVMEDSDGDGWPNHLDVDADGDGMLLEGYGDLDGDGLPDHADADDDGDGVLTVVEGLIDTDGDGFADFEDPDDDGDGVLSRDEDVDGDGDPRGDDSDADGIDDWHDEDDDGDGVLTILEAHLDTDGDGIEDHLDLDDDGDGVPTASEDPDGDGDPTADDTDGDGDPDYLDADDDGDGHDTLDEDGDRDGDPTNDDTDGDGDPDYLDEDDDGDGLLSAYETGDQDGDGVPDHQDPDDDGDSIPTLLEDVDGDGDPRNDDTDTDDTPDYLDTDDDGDGLLSVREGGGDTDGDGIPDHRDLDSDADGFPDSEEGLTDTDGDGLLDFQDADDDGDGVPSVDEEGDFDGDGLPDRHDPDDDDDGVPTSVEGDGDPDGDGIPSHHDDDADGDGLLDRDEGAIDTDLDGEPDVLDLDSDNDGAPDSEEGLVDSDGDAIRDFQDDDDDADGVPSVEEPGDTDRDGTPDRLDRDDDNDGIRTHRELADSGTVGDDPDNDGLPNWRDKDSDGDKASDAEEGRTDYDEDGVLDYLDPDGLWMQVYRGSGLLGCSSGGGAPRAWLGLAGLLALVGRRRRSGGVVAALLAGGLFASSSASAGDEITRSVGKKNGVVVLWPRVVPPTDDPTIQAVAADLQKRLKNLVLASVDERFVDVRPEPERTCPGEGGCRGASLGVLIGHQAGGCAAVALLAQSGESSTQMIPWAGTVQLDQLEVQFRQPPEASLTVTELVPCSEIGNWIRNADLQTALNLTLGEL
jgi:MYXO-CTERM domain-containing protein